MVDHMKIKQREPIRYTPKHKGKRESKVLIAPMVDTNTDQDRGGGGSKA